MHEELDLNLTTGSEEGNIFPGSNDPREEESKRINSYIENEESWVPFKRQRSANEVPFVKEEGLNNDLFGSGDVIEQVIGAGFNVGTDGFGSSANYKTRVFGAWNTNMQIIRTPMDPFLKRQLRMIKNRESAARSRARKLAYTTQLEYEVKNLKAENELLTREYNMIRNVLSLGELKLEDETKNENMRNTLIRTLSSPF